MSKYRDLLAEDDKDEIIGHYISSYVHWISRLQWIGVMLDGDSTRFSVLMDGDQNKCLPRGDEG